MSTVIINEFKFHVRLVATYENESLYTVTLWAQDPDGNFETIKKDSMTSRELSPWMNATAAKLEAAGYKPD